MCIYLLFIILLNIYNAISYNIYVGSTGILFPYSLGALAYIKTHVNPTKYHLKGISGGSWCSILFHFEKQLDNHDKLWNTFIAENNTVSLFDRSAMDRIQNQISTTMKQRYKLANIQDVPISIVVTEFNKFGIPKNKIIKNFENVDDLIDISLCSSYIPFICGKYLYKNYKNKNYIDGAFFHKKQIDNIDIDIDDLLKKRRFEINYRLCIDKEKSRYLFECGWTDAKTKLIYNLNKK